MDEFDSITKGITVLLEEWEAKLAALTEEMISQRRNRQNRSIRQILGHLADSASNNTHRIIHLQYQPSPLQFPNYASHGNNDRWIAIQNYQQEDWPNLLQLWKYANRHLVHVINQVDPSKLDNQWQCDENRLLSLRDGIVDYLRHFKLHLGEIEELMNQ
jgi:hypothetical protein